MTDIKRPSLVKPTLHTHFHIDFNWWRSNDRDWRVYLFSNLCPEHQAAFANISGDETIDWVDPQTAEVHQVEGLQNVLITHCAQQEGFIKPQAPLVDSVLRLFMANSNVPLSCVELGERIGRSPDLILRTLTGGRVFKGLRPCIE